MNSESIIREAMALPLDERAAVVSRLLDSLSAGAKAIDHECVAEFERRWAAFQRGEMKAHSLDETMRMLKERRAG